MLLQTKFLESSKLSLTQIAYLILNSRIFMKIILIWKWTLIGLMVTKLLLLKFFN